VPCEFDADGAPVSTVMDESYKVRDNAAQGDRISASRPPPEISGYSNSL